MNALFKSNNKLNEFLLSLATNNGGMGSFKPDSELEFQEIETSQSQEGKEQFYLQEQDEAPVNSIKTAPFNKFINTGADKTKSKDKAVPQLAIIDYNYVYGFNRGTKTIQIIEGKLCRAIGVNIFLDDQIYPAQGDIQEVEIHNYSICYLKYNEPLEILQSCSYGKASEIILWKVNKNNQRVYLTFMIKLLLPLNSQEIGFTHLTASTLICITKYTIHQQSDLFIFDLSTKKRTRLQKLGKVLNVLKGEELYVINSSGLHVLSTKNETYEMNSIYKPNSIITASEMVNHQQIILALSNRTLELFSFKESKSSITVGIKSQEYVSQLIYLSQNRFLSLESNNKIVLYEIQPAKLVIKTLDQMKLLQENVKTSLLTHQNIIYSCNYHGKIQKINVDKNKLALRKEQQPQISYYRDHLKENEQILLYKAAHKKIFYGIKQTNIFNILELDEQGKISKTTVINLKYKYLTMDVHGTFVAYVIKQTTANSKKSMMQNSALSMIKMVGKVAIEYRYILFLEDYITNKVIFNQELLIKSQCTVIKYNPEGNLLALGFSNGKIIIYNVSPPGKSVLLCQSNEQVLSDFNHSKAIQAIIWSTDGKYLKTISHDNLLFFGLAINGKKEYQLLIYHNNKKMAQNESINLGISKAQWTEMGKFNWKNAKLWKTANEIDEYRCLRQSQEYIVGCMQNGDMRIFNNPTLQNKSTLLKRWFYGPFACEVVQIDSNKLNLIVYGQGILFSVNLQPFQEIQ